VFFNTLTSLKTLEEVGKEIVKKIEKVVLIDLHRFVGFSLLLLE